MNKRIKELIDQVGMRSPDGFKLTVSHMTTFQLEKFAELIVQECACIADDMKALSASEAIKEHFGVEEWH